jgi:hypothetical protein
MPCLLRMAGFTFDSQSGCRMGWVTYFARQDGRKEIGDRSGSGFIGAKSLASGTTRIQTSLMFDPV